MVGSGTDEMIEHPFRTESIANSSLLMQAGRAYQAGVKND